MRRAPAGRGPGSNDVLMYCITSAKTAASVLLGNAAMPASARPRYPLEGRYSVALFVAIAAPIPSLVLISAESFTQQSVIRDLDGSPTLFGVASGLSLAGYAFGALLTGAIAGEVAFFCAISLAV